MRCGPRARSDSYSTRRTSTVIAREARWDRADASANGEQFEWDVRQPHRAYLRRPFDVSDAVCAIRPGSTVRRALRARRLSELRFGARNKLDTIDCGKLGRVQENNR